MRTRAAFSVGVAIVLLASATIPVYAAVTNAAWYRLGENDSGAVHGLEATNSIDVVGNRVLTLVGGPLYDGNVAGAAATHAGSSLSVRFSSGRWGTNALVSTLVDNFGLEVWVNPSALAGDHMIVYNGHTGSSGWGLNLANGIYSVLYGGRAVIGSVPTTSNVWMHLALVRDGGITTFYTNGVASATSSVAPNVPAGLFGVGNAPNPPGAAVFQGSLDEVRVFTFAPGQFSTNDLLLNRPVLLTPIAWYRLGESDPDAAHGTLANNSIDLVNKRVLSLAGGPLYNTNVASSAATNIGSSLSVHFAGNQWGTNALVSTVVDNFGLELWVNPSALAGDHMLVYNGHTGNSGWGLGLANGIYSGLFGGRVGIGSASAASNVWTHLALVRASGITTLYVDGIASGSSDVPPAVPTGLFGVATAPNPPGVAVFQGSLDELRVFTFAPGSFSTADLLLKFGLTTSPATGLGPSHATLNGRVNPNGLATTAWFEWGATTNFGEVTAARDVGSFLTNFSQLITGLTPTVTYYFRAVASNSSGVVFGRVQSFTTPTSVFTTAATAIGPVRATLNGNVNPDGLPTTAWFEWGTTTNYGQSTGAQDMGSGSASTNFNQAITGLAPTMTYYFRAAASNTAGVVFGAAQSFTTPTSVFTTAATAVGPVTATLNGTVNPDGLATTAWFEWGTTTNYGQVTPTQAMGGGSPTNFNQVITGLTAIVTYYFRAVASNSAAIVFGVGQSFTTPASVFTLAAIAVGATSATLNGSVHPIGLETVAWFEWGTTTNYGQVTPTQAIGSGDAYSNLTQVITGLAPGVTHYFRAASSNSAGLTFGSGLTFVTPVFSNINGGLPGVSDSAAAWGDYDNDGRLDILLNGHTGSFPLSQIWRNTVGGFTNVTGTVAPGLPGLYAGSVAWGDYDNDGRLDFLLTGFGSSATSQIWRNTGSGFANVTSLIAPGLPGVASSAVAWGDYDNDGRLDFLLTGYNGTTPVSQIWRNTGAGFTNVTGTVAPGLPAIFQSSVAWGDYDNDGWLDLLLMGFTGGFPVSQIWRNTGVGFTHVTGMVAPGLLGLYAGSVAWGDYDNDGRLDFLITGSAFSQIWRNTGATFANVTGTVAPGLPAIIQSSVAWGDYDNDGRLDFFIMGRSGAFASQVWRNTGNGFTNVTGSVAPGLPQGFQGSVVWGDYDNDSRLDFLVTANSTVGLIAQVWRNNTPQTNTPPAAPTGFTAAVSNGVIRLSWNAAHDAEGPAAGLNYNLRVGTSAGGSEIFAAMSHANGTRRLPARGNREKTLSFPLPLTLGQPYYCAVQTIDTSFAGSAFASASFRPLQSPIVLATATATNLLPGDANGDASVSQSELADVLAHLNGNGIVTQSDLDLVLSSYWPYSPWLAMTNVAGLGGANVTFTLTNSIAGAFGVESTTNLMDWELLGPATPRYEFTDTNAPAGPRYYRLRWP